MSETFLGKPKSPFGNIWPSFSFSTNIRTYAWFKDVLSGHSWWHYFCRKSCWPKCTIPKDEYL